MWILFSAFFSLQSQANTMISPSAGAALELSPYTYCDNLGFSLRYTALLCLLYPGQWFVKGVGKHPLLALELALELLASLLKTPHISHHHHLC